MFREETAVRYPLNRPLVTYVAIILRSEKARALNFANYSCEFAAMRPNAFAALRSWL